VQLEDVFEVEGLLLWAAAASVRAGGAVGIDDDLLI
jgi:hypothetical protein